MKVVVGLGNPGEKYSNTRHNIGFRVVDEILKTYHGSPTYNKKFESIIYSLDTDRLLLKPQTFMNSSGKAVNRVANFYKIKPEGLLVVHDDVDLNFGEIKHQFGISSAGHKGVQSIIEAVGSEQFGRVRIGVGRPNQPAGGKIDTESWVLQNFSEDTGETQKLVERAAEVVVNWLKE
ncbi:MAG: aminoacyl-tRNA hydrolase [Candidatus Woykebacteria bacterium]